MKKVDDRHKQDRKKEDQSTSDPADACTTDVTRRDAVTVGLGAALTSLLPGSLTAAPNSETAASKSAAAVPITLNINGETHSLHLEPRVTLLDALREYAGLTGTKKGCDHGQCGACTVLINGERINSCLTLAVMHQHDHITTIEGLATGNRLHPVQAAFIEHDAFQCGYCTPGQICSAVGLINEGHAHTEDEIREDMAGNICRCGAYPNIVSAVRQVIQKA